jgi:hypothetical protein
MAARKKAKGKAKRKPKAKVIRRKAAARRPAPRKKTAAPKKTAKKAPARRAPRAAAAPAPAVPAEQAPPGQRIGVVTHYFSELSVAVIKLETGTLRVGDHVHFRGHTTDFDQHVESLQINHAPVVEAGPGDDFGMKVREHAREHDLVYKVK